MSVLFKKSLADVKRRKLRTALTVLGIAIGVMGLTAINFASAQLKASIAYTNDASAQPDITFSTSPASAALTQSLATQPNVKAAQAETQAFGRWAVPSGHIGLVIVGVGDPAAVTIGKFQVTEGRLPGAGEILLESSDRSVATVKVGDTITIQLGGMTRHLTVSGFARSAGIASAATTQTARGYMRESDIEAAVGTTGANVFLVQLRDYSERDATARQLANVLENGQAHILSVEVGRASDSGAQTINGLFGVMQVLSIIALLLSVFLLLSTITTLIGEQMPIIGTMKAVGASSGQVLRTYLTSVFVYGVIGTVIGMGLGVGAGFLLYSLFASLFTLDAVPLAISPALILAGLFVGIGIPLLAALLPVYFGTRMTVRQALAGYGLDAGARTRRGTGVAGSVFGFTPQTAQLGMRSLFRKRARALLSAEPGIEVVGEATSGEEAVTLVEELHPDVALMDINMSGISGIEATRRITRANPQAGVLVLTMFDDDDSVFAAMRAGARGYLLKGAAPDDAIRAIRAVSSGEAIFSPSVALRLMQYFAAPPVSAASQAFPELTEREREVLELIAQGYTNTAIAERLVLSAKTVRNHVSNLFAKLQVAGRAEAIIRARDAGLGTMKPSGQSGQ